MEPISFDFDPSINHLEDRISNTVDRTLDMAEGLTEQQLFGPYSPRLNPFLWEITHSLWFLENWTLRHIFDKKPFFDGMDDIYNSPNIRHGKRWASNLKPFGVVEDFAEYLKESLLIKLESSSSEEFLYYLTYALHHSDMHTEALTYQRHTRGLSPPEFMSDSAGEDAKSNPDSKNPGDSEIPGGSYRLGALKTNNFVFDNEKWAHTVEIDPFEISRTPVTQAQFRRFVDDDGYGSQQYWSEDGWEWLQSTNLRSPLYWKRTDDGDWAYRFFDDWKPLQADLPVTEVNFYEAQAYCSWAGRRLPTEAEWELTASGWQSGDPETKLTYPWGSVNPDESRANLDWSFGGPISVNALPESESPFGARQLIGNCWEWTSSDFKPFPGFSADFYKQYSEPWFGSRKVLRGGSWMTRSALIRNGFRNFFTPDRNDIPAGFRTCPIN